jgi:hypothetical protein
VVRRKHPVTAERQTWVAVANRHQGILEIFKGTRWANGGHIEPLRQLDGAFAPASPVHFVGSSDRATLLPLKYFPQVDVGQHENDIEDLDVFEKEGADADA